MSCAVGTGSRSKVSSWATFPTVAPGRGREGCMGTIIKPKLLIRRKKLYAQIHLNHLL